VLAHQSLHALAIDRCAELAARQRGDHPRPVGRVGARDLKHHLVDAIAPTRLTGRRTLRAPVERLAADSRHAGHDGRGTALRDQLAGPGGALSHSQPRTRGSMSAQVPEVQRAAEDRARSRHEHHPLAERTTRSALRCPRKRGNSNRTEPLEMVEAEHRAHAVVELAIRDLKDQALAHFPSGQFNANSAWTVIACLAHNLLRQTTLIGLPGQTVRAARTLRRRLLAIPGRLTRHGRAWTLHLPARWPWQHDFIRALARIRALPAPA
jgi:hypothetical protein